MFDLEENSSSPEGAVFSRPDVLGSGHKGKKTVKCRKCEKCDSNIGIHNKNIHPNTVHEGNKLVKCEQCIKCDSNIGNKLFL